MKTFYAWRSEADHQDQSAVDNRGPQVMHCGTVLGNSLNIRTIKTAIVVFCVLVPPCGETGARQQHNQDQIQNSDLFFEAKLDFHV